MDSKSLLDVQDTLIDNIARLKVVSLALPAVLAELGFIDARERQGFSLILEDVIESLTDVEGNLEQFKKGV